MFPRRPAEGLDEPSKSIRTGTDRQTGGQGRVSGKTVAESGPCRQSQGLGVGGGFKGAEDDGRRWSGAVRLLWGAGVYPEATAEPQRVFQDSVCCVESGLVLSRHWQGRAGHGGGDWEKSI